MNAPWYPPAARALGLALLLLVVPAGASRAGSDLNEVGALLVFPLVVSVPGQETFVTITNAASYGVTAHVAYINGDPTPIGEGGAGYCYECDFDLPLTGNDTETLVISHGPYGVAIATQDTQLSLSCSFPYGMLIVSIEDATGRTLTDNVLIGEEVVTDYATGAAYSLSALPFQGRAAGNGDRRFSFDDLEYGKLPRIVAASFLAPDLPTQQARITADLVVFTPDFERQLPPRTDCSVTGFDASENPFSASFQFGCWAVADLCAVSPEFCYPNLGLFAAGDPETHGWLQLNCRVDRDRNGTFDASGGVHGALLQTAATGAVVRRNDPGAPALASAASWARLLHQSVTTGDSITLELAPRPGGLN